MVIGNGDPFWPLLAMGCRCASREAKDMNCLRLKTDVLWTLKI